MFARRVAARGMTAVLPDLFGAPGREPSTGYLLRTFAKICVNKEFTLMATNKTSPVVNYLRELAAHEHETHGGPGVGAVGMCLTGGFALAMCVDDVVIAPVLSQPGLPMPLGAKRRAGLGLAESDLLTIKSRAQKDLCVMGFASPGDPAVPRERFETLRRELGDSFIGVDIDSSKGQSVGLPQGRALSTHGGLLRRGRVANPSSARRRFDVSFDASWCRYCPVVSS